MHPTSSMHTTFTNNPQFIDIFLVTRVLDKEYWVRHKWSQKFLYRVWNTVTSRSLGRLMVICPSAAPLEILGDWRNAQVVRVRVTSS